GHDTAFEPFHRLGLQLGLVIVTFEMQKPVHRQMGEVMKEVTILISAFPFESLEGDHDIAEYPWALAGVRTRSGKGQNIGRLVDATPVPVERADSRIVGEHNTDFTARC